MWKSVRKKRASRYQKGDDPMRKKNYPVIDLYETGQNIKNLILLKGLTVNTYQAIDLSKLLGINIRQVQDGNYKNRGYVVPWMYCDA